MDTLLSFKNDKDVMLAAVGQSSDLDPTTSQYYASSALKHAPLALTTDRDFMIAAVARVGHALSYASKTLQNDKEVVLVACTQGVQQWAYGCTSGFRHASAEMKSDPDVLRADFAFRKVCALKRLEHCREGNGTDITKLADDLKNDRDVGLAATEACFNAFRYVSAELKGDKEVVLDVVARSESYAHACFCHAAKEFRDDKDVVLAAVQASGGELQYASSRLQDDKDVVRAAGPGGLEYASAGLRRAAENNWYDGLCFDSELQCDKSFVLAAATKDGGALRFASNALKADVDVVLAAFTQNAQSLDHAADEAKSNATIVLEILKKSESCGITFCSDTLFKDNDFLLAAVTHSGNVLEHASKALQNEKKVVLAAVTQNGTALRYASQEMKTDKHVVHAAMRQHFSALSFASDALLKDVEFVCLLVKDNFEAVKYALGLLVDSKTVFEAAKQSIIASFRSASEAASWSEKLDPLFNANAYADPLFTTCGKIKGIEAAIESQLRGDGGGDGGTAPALPGASLWDTADKDANNLMSANVAAALLSSSGLQQMVLRTVWRDAKKDAAVKSSPGTMNKEEFEAAVSLAVTAGGVFAVAAPAHALKARFNALLADPNVADAAKSATLTIFSKVDFFDEGEFPYIMANYIRPSYLRADKDLALLSLSKQLYYASEHFETFPAEFLADRDFMLAACKIHGGSIGHAGAKYLPADSFVVIKKLVPPGQVDPVTFHFRPFGESEEEEETTGENFAEQGFPELTAAQAAFANDKEMLMATFEASSHHHECSLQYASDELKDDKEVVLAAVSSSIASFGGNNDGQYNGSLSHASDNLKNDEAVVLAAISQSEKALDHASELLKVDKDFLCTASKVNWKVLKVVGSETTRNACLFQLYPVGEATAIAEAGKATHAADVAQIVQRWEQHVAKKADLETQESASGSHAAELDKMKADYDAAKAAKDWKGAKALKIALDAATLGANSSNSGSDGAAAASPKDKSPQDIIKESTTKASERTAYNAKWVVKKAAAQIAGQRDALCSKEDNQHLYCIPLLAAAYSQMEDERGEADDLEAAEAYGEAAAAATELAKNLDELFPGKTNAIWGPLKVD